MVGEVHDRDMASRSDTRTTIESTLARGIAVGINCCAAAFRTGSGDYLAGTGQLGVRGPAVGLGLG